MAKTICGVDVDSRCLQVRIGPDGPSRSFRNTTAGIAELASFCQTHQVELVAMEATGGYEKRAFQQLWTSGLPVAVLNPRAVPRFAQALGLLEKTDRIDAGVIARFADVKGAVPQKRIGAMRRAISASSWRICAASKARSWAKEAKKSGVGDQSPLLALGDLQIGELTKPSHESFQVLMRCR